MISIISGNTWMCSPRWRKSAARRSIWMRFRALDKERRELITTTEQLKAQRNKANDEIATLKKSKQHADAKIAEMKQVSERIKQGDERITQLDATQREFLLTIPNVPHSSCRWATARKTMWKCDAGARRRNLILRRSRTGKSASVLGFSIWERDQDYWGAICDL